MEPIAFEVYVNPKEEYSDEWWEYEEENNEEEGFECDFLSFPL